MRAKLLNKLTKNQTVFAEQSYNDLTDGSNGRWFHVKWPRWESSWIHLV